MSAALSEHAKKALKNYVSPSGLSTIGRKIQHFLDFAATEAPKEFFQAPTIYKMVNNLVRSPGSRELQLFKNAIRSSRKSLRNNYGRELISDRLLGYRASANDDDKEIPIDRAIRRGKLAQKNIISITDRMDTSTMHKKVLKETVLELQSKAQPALKGWEKLEQRLLGSGAKTPKSG